MNYKYKNGDLKLDLWEADLWISLYAIGFAYFPTEKIDHTNSYYKFVKYLSYVLPCKFYRKIFRKISKNKKENNTFLQPCVFNDKHTFTMWIFNIHKKMYNICKLPFNETYIQLQKLYSLENPTCQHACSINSSPIHSASTISRCLTNCSSSMQDLSETNVSSVENSKSGLIPTFWGPRLWNLLHAISFHYDPSKSKKYLKTYVDLHIIFFKLVGLVIPCMYCRKSYIEKINTPGKLYLDHNTVLTQNTLTIWLYNIHKQVNIKLNHINLPFSSVIIKYEAFRYRL